MCDDVRDIHMHEMRACASALFWYIEIAEIEDKKKINVYTTLVLVSGCSLVAGCTLVLPVTSTVTS